MADAVKKAIVFFIMAVVHSR